MATLADSAYRPDGPINAATVHLAAGDPYPMTSFVANVGGHGQGDLTMIVCLRLLLRSLWALGREWDYIISGLKVRMEFEIDEEELLDRHSPDGLGYWK